ncbi:hypothetical protein G6F55_014440 [Rhizopus delemar]|nr:hypothetical protein G6F55_014440 [Rhizopus delemar]
MPARPGGAAARPATGSRPAGPPWRTRLPARRAGWRPTVRAPWGHRPPTATAARACPAGCRRRPGLGPGGASAARCSGAAGRRRPRRKRRCGRVLRTG